MFALRAGSHGGDVEWVAYRVPQQCGMGLRCDHVMIELKTLSTYTLPHPRLHYAGTRSILAFSFLPIAMLKSCEVGPRRPNKVASVHVACHG